MEQIMGSTGLWIACSIMIIITAIQAAVYFGKAWKTALEMGFDRKTLMACVRSTAIASFGPSCAIGVGVVALTAIIGAPLAWMRLSVIGALVYEGANVEIATEALSVTAATLTPETFAAIAFAMGLSGCFWQLNVVLFAPSYDKVIAKISRGDTKVLTVICLATMTAIFARSVVPNILKISRTSYAIAIGMVVTFVLNRVITKAKMYALREWALPIAMLCGMFGALLF